MSDNEGAHPASTLGSILTAVFSTLAGILATVGIRRYRRAYRAMRRQALSTSPNKPVPQEEQPRPTFFDLWQDRRMGSDEGLWSDIKVSYIGQ
jgi:hypothetical protein